MAHDDNDNRPPDDRLWPGDPDNTWSQQPDDDPWERDQNGRPIRKKKRKGKA